MYYMEYSYIITTDHIETFIRTYLTLFTKSESYMFWNHMKQNRKQIMRKYSKNTRSFLTG
jgi:hypothetical protein